MQSSKTPANSQQNNCKILLQRFACTCPRIVTYSQTRLQVITYMLLLLMKMVNDCCTI